MNWFPYWISIFRGIVLKWTNKIKSYSDVPFTEIRLKHREITGECREKKEKAVLPMLEEMSLIIILYP